MDDPQEFKSLDELFQKTFENLSDTPSASGWDTPSPRVWEQVRTQLKPPKSGWSAQSIFLVSALAIVLMLGLFWAITRPETPSTPDTPREQPAVTQPEVLLPPAESQPDVSSERNIHRTEQPVFATPATRPTPAAGTDTPLPSNNTPTEENSDLRLPAGSAPMPGTNPVSPNTTIRRQAEAWRSAPWAQPLAPLPGILDSRFIRPVPESLKLLYTPGKPAKQ